MRITSCLKRVYHGGPISTAYDSGAIELRLRKLWEAEDYQQSSSLSADKGPVAICLPPPNVTGNLHLGHALTVAIQDTLVRWYRMKGHVVTWIPGVDHAGIATQMIVEKQLLRRLKLKKREELKRDEFINECRRWKNERTTDITDQLKHIGATLDWSKMYYTMDESFSDAVIEAFIRLHDEGLIYRDKRLVNYSPYLKSTISDIEVDTLDVKAPMNYHLPDGSVVRLGYLYHFAYPLSDQSGEIIVATNRPETLLADVAVAVHPDDDRYKKIVGKTVLNPFTGLLMPIVADVSVNQKFATGAVKITPGHSHSDFELARRHQLNTEISCLDDEGKVNFTCFSDDIQSEAVAIFNGLPRFEARMRLVEALQQCGLMRGMTAQQTTIPICSRSGDILEPMLREQFFLKIKPLAHKAIEAVNSGRLSFIPAYWQKDWAYWLNRTEDWCISRQLWWGHQIPAYRVVSQRSSSESSRWVAADSLEEAKVKAEKLFGHSELTLTRDCDVLDTWFSSALVPLVITGWPNAPSSPLYPLTLMETGYDILGFWVSRMVMLCSHLTSTKDIPDGICPFPKILLHGMIRDAQGRKMSKSLGNVIDPRNVIEGITLDELKEQVVYSNLDEVEIATAQEGILKNFPKGIAPCGADALRFTLMSQDVKNQTICLDVSLAHNYRNFCNKIWNSFKYAQTVWNATSDDSMTLLKSPNNLVDRWILSQLAKTVETVNVGLEQFDFHLANIALHDFMWLKFCDIYIEQTKSALWNSNAERLKEIQPVMFIVFDTVLKLLSPTMPFITEELYAALSHHADSHLPVTSVHKQSFPNTSEFQQYRDVSLDNDFNVLLKIITAVRSARTDFDLKQTVPMKGYLMTSGAYESTHNTLDSSSLIEELCKTSLVRISAQDVKSLPTNRTVTIIDDGLELYLDVMTLVDTSQIVERLEKQLAKRRKRRANVVRSFQRSSKENADVKSAKEESVRQSGSSTVEPQWQRHRGVEGRSEDESSAPSDSSINRQLSMVKQLNSLDAEISRLQSLVKQAKSVSGKWQ